MKKDNKESHSGETFAIIALIAALIAALLMLTSCSSTEAQTTSEEEEKIYIHMSDGDSLELVADEYGGQYLKQEASSGKYVYIPYPGETSEPDSLRFYNAKN